ncbi:hypothetical protein BDZ88DRAFT_436520 [Geranomyces variabilis]|nr:hypothetical protein BDZ88DRAFT_436520 [Geranomyces variabilis]
MSQPAHLLAKVLQLAPIAPPRHVTDASKPQKNAIMNLGARSFRGAMRKSPRSARDEPVQNAHECAWMSAPSPGKTERETEREREKEQTAEDKEEPVPKLRQYITASQTYHDCVQARDSCSYRLASIDRGNLTENQRKKVKQLAHALFGMVMMNTRGRTSAVRADNAALLIAVAALSLRGGRKIADFSGLFEQLVQTSRGQATRALADGNSALMQLDENSGESLRMMMGEPSAGHANVSDGSMSDYDHGSGGDDKEGGGNHSHPARRLSNSMPRHPNSWNTCGKLEALANEASDLKQQAARPLLSSSKSFGRSGSQGAGCSDIALAVELRRGASCCACWRILRESERQSTRILTKAPAEAAFEFYIQPYLLPDEIADGGPPCLSHWWAAPMPSLRCWRRSFLPIVRSSEPLTDAERSQSSVSEVTSTQKGAPRSPRMNSDYIWRKDWRWRDIGKKLQNERYRAEQARTQANEVKNNLPASRKVEKPQCSRSHAAHASMRDGPPAPTI